MSRVILVSGLGYGDEGKGTTVDFLAHTFSDVHTVVRANGGAQAVHHVITSDGKLHAFRQFGSASFVRQIRTHHSRFMLVSPPHLLSEAKELTSLGVGDVLSRLTIDEQTPLITPWHRAANWLREIARNRGQHGTTGMGISEVMRDVVSAAPDLLYAGDLRNAQLTARKVYQIRRRKQIEVIELIRGLSQPFSERAQTALNAFSDEETLSAYLWSCHNLRQQVGVVAGEYLGAVLNQDGTVVFEGAQGALLDEWYGFHPHTTWSTTTFDNPLALLAEQGYHSDVTRLGVLRAYGTRHGAGPFVTEDLKLTQALPDWHNRNDGWPGDFRVGWFDLVTARYALAVANGAEGLSLTCLDRIHCLPETKVAVAYRYHGTASINELSAFFEVESSNDIPRIVAIKVDRSRNLERQAALTNHLSYCSPEYVTMLPEKFLSFATGQLPVPIVVTSYGPKARDKHFVEARLL